MTNSRLPRATHGSNERPLTLGGVEIPCYVLEDGRRVLTRRGVLGEHEAAAVSERDALLPASVPTIRFRAAEGGPILFGYDATQLPEVCGAVLEAARTETLTDEQVVVAARCERLLEGFARVGLIALIDETTGYQTDRRRSQLRSIFSAHVAPELVAWTERFPTEFYQELFRLLDWPGEPDLLPRPALVGYLTNVIIYQRLPPGVVDELRRLAPHDGPRPRDRYGSAWPRRAETDLGDQLHGTLALMRRAGDWSEFTRLLAASYPMPDDPLPQFLADDWPAEGAERQLG